MKVSKGKVLFALAALLLVGAAAFAFPYVRDFLAIDSCLDSGGAWDYAAKVCQH